MYCCYTSSNCYPSLCKNQNVAAEANALVTDLQFARSEAIKRGIPVNVCSANSDRTVCSGSATWSNGWITNTIADPATGVKLAATNILQLQAALTSTNTMQSNSTQTLCTIAFNRYGFYLKTSTCANATGTGSITVTAPNCTEATSTSACMKTVCVNAVGKVTVVSGADALSPR